MTKRKPQPTKNTRPLTPREFARTQPLPSPKDSPLAPEKKPALTNSEKQSAYTLRKTRAGFVRKTIWINTQDFQIGFEDEREGHNHLPPKGRDPLSWLCGFVAARRPTQPHQLADLFTVIDGQSYLGEMKP